MNERVQKLAEHAGLHSTLYFRKDQLTNFAELIMHDIHKKVIASILITDILMEEKGQVPTSEDYIRAINEDLEIEE